MSGRWLTAALLLCAAVPAWAQKKVDLPAHDRPLSMDMRTLFTLGAVDGEDHENFALVTDVAFDAKGSVYVLDAQAFRVIVFDPAGRFVRVIGRQGGGPGEFTFPSGIALLPGGELVVNDAGRGRLHIFDADGEFQRSVALDEDLGRALGRLRAGSAGTVLTETARILVPGRRGDGSRVSLPPRSVTALVLDTVAHGTRLFNAAPRELRTSSSTTTSQGGARFTMTLTAFEPDLLWTPLPDGGAAISSSVGYRVVLTDARGRPAHYLERAVEPRKVTAADRERWLEQRATGGAGTAFVMATGSGAAPRGSPPSPSVVRVDPGSIDEDDVNWGDVVPVIAALATDSFGRIWVQRSDRDLGDGPIDIIDSGMKYLGTLPEQAMPRAFGPDGRVAYVVRDDLDVQRIIVRQITR